MTIREVTDSDISSIVALLKLSLGESLMPKSEAFWKWKHVDNPFGRSPVLLALDGEKLIGVRAFMRWEWIYQNQIIKSVRAVDTAVHPDYQGKGIFSELTMTLVEQCRQEGIQFIFNSPNKKSLPGYLKLGWKQYERMKVNTHFLISSFWRKIDAHPKRYCGETESNPIPKLVDKLVTNKSKEYLAWRYADNPNAEYFTNHTDNCRFIYRIKKTGKLHEMRLVEFFWEGKEAAELRWFIKQEAYKNKVNIITWSGLLVPLISIQPAIGPIITTNDLNPDKSLPLKHWVPTLGDMEVF